MRQPSVSNSSRADGTGHTLCARAALATLLLSLAIATTPVFGEDDNSAQIGVQISEKKTVTGDEPQAEAGAAGTEQQAAASQQDGEQNKKVAAKEPAEPSADRFDPSEEISKDLSVSFPADI
ncbi:hypothetical protein G8764_10350 [Pseudomaricurvus alcaniphilus]|uniref:hypothetical protein n=1 Tax=Pseudomaricurvus alcaniphilus TaxID=1166482 RepID=UPI00140AB073|nr:hypothetical protein [Pseudomaricurvus alcaniphilus]NHN37695.1 hypothetical protein [Pseudomaricurvus alcaniphilus]